MTIEEVDDKLVIEVSKEKYSKEEIEATFKRMELDRIFVNSPVLSEEEIEDFFRKVNEDRGRIMREKFAEFL